MADAALGAFAAIELESARFLPLCRSAHYLRFLPSAKGWPSEDRASVEGQGNRLRSPAEAGCAHTNPRHPPPASQRAYVVRQK